MPQSELKTPSTRFLSTVIKTLTKEGEETSHYYEDLDLGGWDTVTLIRNSGCYISFLDLAFFSKNVIERIKIFTSLEIKDF